MVRDPFSHLIRALPSALAALLVVVSHAQAQFSYSYLENWTGLEVQQPVDAGPYRLAVDERGHTLRISRQGIEIMALRNGGFLIHNGGVAQDITGEGRTQVAVIGVSQMHNTYSDELYIIDIDGEFRARLAVTFDTADINLLDIDGKPGLEIETADLWTSYDTDHFFDVAAGRVVLRFDGDRYVASAPLMRRDPPTDQQLAAQIRDARERWETGSAHAGDVFWYVMVPLIYQGNLGTACHFYDDAWPATEANMPQFLHKRTLLATFLDDVKARRFGEAIPGLWAAIAELNGVPVDGKLTCPSVSR